MSSILRDPDFQEKLLAFYCRDRNFLKRTSGILTPEDFKPRKDEGMIEAYWIAQKAYKHWHDYKEPVGGMLNVEMMDFIRENKKKVSSKSRQRISDLVSNIKHANGLVAVEAIEKKIFEYKQREQKKRAVRELIDLQEKGELSDHRWMKICREAIKFHDNTIRVSNYAEEIDKRIERRRKNRSRKFPHFLIPELDKLIRSFPRGEVGLALAKYNVGKSAFAVWLDYAYAVQSLKVLHVTLEDPGEWVEDRLDALFSGIPMKELDDRARRLRKRLRKALSRVRNNIRVVDGTDEGMTVDRIEETWDNLRNQGFSADVVIVDADEGIVPPEHYKGENGERRESVDIYKALKRFASRRDLYLWAMAQSQRGKPGKKQMIVTGDNTATDISKVRRAALGIGIGDGPEGWPDDARYLFVMRHRYDKARIGCPIMGDFKRAIFYDKQKTAKMQDEHRGKHKEKI